MNSSLPRYNAKLHDLLVDVTETFSALTKPPESHFCCARVSDKTPAKTVEALGLLKDGDVGAITKETVELATQAIPAYDADVVLWIIPTLLYQLEQFWQGILTQDIERYGREEVVTLERAVWRMEKFADFRSTFGIISRRFCSTRKLSKNNYSDIYIRQQLEKRSLSYQGLMSAAMRRAMKNYLLEWYVVFGGSFFISKRINEEPRQSVYDCWL